MVNRSVYVGIKLTPREAESELWNMNDVQQIEFMVALAERYRLIAYDVLMQMQAISDKMDELLNPDERKAIIHVIERFLEYIKKDDKDEYELKDLGNGCYEKVLKQKEGEGND